MVRHTAQFGGRLEKETPGGGNLSGRLEVTTFVAIILTRLPLLTSRKPLVSAWYAAVFRNLSDRAWYSRSHGYRPHRGFAYRRAGQVEPSDQRTPAQHCTSRKAAHDRGCWGRTTGQATCQRGCASKDGCCTEATLGEDQGSGEVMTEMPCN